MITLTNQINLFITSNREECVMLDEGKSDRRHVIFEGDG